MSAAFVFVFVFALAADVAAAPQVPANPDPLPAAGATGVVLNPLILVVDPFTDVQIRDNGAAIVSASNSLVSGPGFSSLRRVVLGELLRPQTHYSVVAVVPDENGDLGVDRTLTDFTTGDAADDVVPGGVVAVHHDGVLHIDADEPIPVVDVRHDQGPSTLYFLDDNGDATITFSGVLGGTLSIVAFDAAANAAAPVEVAADFTSVANGLDEDDKGCASTSSSSSLLSALALLLLLRRRR